MAVCVVLVAIVGCTPEQITWAHWLNRDVPSGPVPCRQWVGSSRGGGFTDDQLSTVQRIMWRESRCDPDAVSSAGALGLMQVMPMWADDCGLTPADLFVPDANLACAHHVWEVQGWPAWSTWP